MEARGTLEGEKDNDVRAKPGGLLCRACIDVPASSLSRPFHSFVQRSGHRSDRQLDPRISGCSVSSDGRDL
jgi:hypothetical protein